MPHDVAFHQGLHCLYRLKRSSDKKIQFFLIIMYNLPPLDMYNGLSHVYCIKPEGIIHYKYTKGKRVNNLEFQIKKTMNEYD